ncbi:hypothetical protein JAAARDRAFT_174577 [Jaapia argillacea MUCL 33604]|uniref:BTB domain-containing protein n=1 Tax=Jaapia argillacea MUCL 33604 TaxID=933084 RepID=A0A067QD00_9AGAM|nr:hypothetical protein JAAARDRAFT_174577 [Jaapia argillacea MUCL 33604]
MSTSSENPTTSPFDDPSADVILRSSDGIEFPTFTTLLSLASPVFRDMEGVSRAGADVKKEGIPVVEMDEDGRVLKLLLRFCYPKRKPVIKTFEDAKSLLIAAKKYDMEFIVEASKERLLKEGKDDPIALYAFACAHKLRDLARDAAIMALRKTENELLPPDSPPLIAEFHDISAWSFMQLLYYHRKCVSALSSLDIEQAAKPSIPRCASCSPGNSVYSSLWSPFTNRLRVALMVRPHGDVVQYAARVMRSQCPHCSSSESVSNDISTCIKKLTNHINTVVAKVPLELGF